MKQRIIDIAIGLFIGVIAVVGLYFATAQPQGQPVTLMPTPTPRPIVVFITGAVERPGVYTIPGNSRLFDAVTAAGGFIEGAKVEEVNLAKLLTDGDKINVPGAVDAPTPALIIGGDGISVTPTAAVGEPININTATQSELEKLPGIGPSLAQAIISYREENGDFIELEEMLNVPGIGPATLNRIRPYIFIEEEQ